MQYAEQNWCFPANAIEFFVFVFFCQKNNTQDIFTAAGRLVTALWAGFILRVKLDKYV